MSLLFRVISSALLLVFTLACGPIDRHELARQHPWDWVRSKGQFVNTGEIEVFAIQAGQGPVVLLLHGFIDSSYTWREVIPELARDHEVHAIDIPGFGLSENPIESDYNAAWQAEQIVAYMDAANLSQASLVGNSMGGHIASEVAIRYPERVHRLVLIAAGGLPEPQQRELVQSSVTRRLLTLLASPMGQAVWRAFPTQGILRAEIERAYFRATDLSDARLATWHRPLLTENGMGAVLAFMDRSPNAARSRQVQSIQAATLVMVGLDDEILDPEVSRSYHQLLPNSELMEMADTCHLIQEQRPQEVTAAIRRWVAKK